MLVRVCACARMCVRVYELVQNLSARVCIYTHALTLTDGTADTHLSGFYTLFTISQ